MRRSIPSSVLQISLVSTAVWKVSLAFMWWKLCTQCNGSGRWNLWEVARLQDALEAEMEKGGYGGCGLSRVWAMGWAVYGGGQAVERLIFSEDEVSSLPLSLSLSALPLCAVEWPSNKPRAGWMRTPQSWPSQPLGQWEIPALYQCDARAAPKERRHRVLSSNLQSLIFTGVVFSRWFLVVCLSILDSQTCHPAGVQRCYRFRFPWLASLSQECFATACLWRWQCSSWKFNSTATPSVEAGCLFSAINFQHSETTLSLTPALDI